MRVARIRRAMLPVAAVSLLACTASPPDRQTTRDLTGYAQPGCGPADGPAVEIYLAAGGFDDGDPHAMLDSLARIGVPPTDTLVRPTVSAQPVLRVLVWEGADRVRGRRFVFREGDHDRGEVAICTPGGGCAPVAHAQFRFDPTGDRNLAGEYEVARSGDVVETGHFRTRWVDRPVLCG